MGVEPFLQLRQRDMRHMPIVESFEGQTKFRAKLFESQFRDASALKNVIAGPPDRRQIIHQRARPVEDDVANHLRTVGTMNDLANVGLDGLSLRFPRYFFGTAGT